jgi:hypothetical protein
MTSILLWSGIYIVSDHSEPRCDELPTGLL